MNPSRRVAYLVNTIRAEMADRGYFVEVLRVCRMGDLVVFVGYSEVNYGMEVDAKRREMMEMGDPPIYDAIFGKLP